MSSFTRRGLLGAGLASTGGLLLAGCDTTTATAPGYVSPTGPQVRAAERRRHPGAVRSFDLTARAGDVDLGGRTVRTASYGGAVPGAEIRVRAGEQVRAVLHNRLPDPTTLHWHGVALRNNADGVPDVTQPAVQPGASFSYQFTASAAGTYWFHPHVGTQLDRGLYGPLIVEDPDEPGDYDHEWTVVLDDWLDGVTGTPDRVLTELTKGMASMGRHMMMGATSPLLGGDAGDVRYPYFVLNGRLPTAPTTFRAGPGQRVRLRVINAGGDTAFRLALGGHRLRITHADGYPVRPVDADAILLGMGERYDATVTLSDGAFPLVALAEGKGANAFGIVRTGGGAAPRPSARPAELGRRVLPYRALAPTDAARLPDRRVDRTITLRLGGGMSDYAWTINGRRYSASYRIPIESGQRVRLRIVNDTSMWHPMHLHGHSFALASGTRKDTAIVLPHDTLTADFDADNPGLWMLHCHNIYHAEAGMMTILGYRSTGSS